MKNKSKAKSSALRRVPSPDQTHNLLCDIRESLRFLCEAKNREEIRQENAKSRAESLARAAFKMLGSTAAIPPDVAVEFESFFADENKN